MVNEAVAVKVVIMLRPTSSDNSGDKYCVDITITNNKND